MTLLEDSFVFIIIIAYWIVSYFFIRFLGRSIVSLNPWLQLLIKAFLFALFWGIGIAGSDAEPGFGIPAPNVFVIPLMLIQGFYSGVLSGLFILLFWWILIFSLMIIVYFLRRKKTH